MEAKFHYFGYGSNMLAKRIHIHNPTAERIGPGLLKEYNIDFGYSSSQWKGAAATILPCCGGEVYGAIWQIDCINMENLDNQEGVQNGVYTPITVPVKNCNNGEMMDCRVYHLTKQPTEPFNSFDDDDIPSDRKPSKTYLKTIIKGAIETGIPQEYIKCLCKIKHNGRVSDLMEKQLGLETVKLEDD